MYLEITHIIGILHNLYILSAINGMYCTHMVIKCAAFPCLFVFLCFLSAFELIHLVVPEKQLLQLEEIYLCHT